jgi:hypothetical protein
MVCIAVHRWHRTSHQHIRDRSEEIDESSVRPRLSYSRLEAGNMDEEEVLLI